MAQEIFFRALTNADKPFRVRPVIHGTDEALHVVETSGGDVLTYAYRVQAQQIVASLDACDHGSPLCPHRAPPEKRRIAP